MSGSNVQPAPVKGFLERLQDGVVVGDGAMGTMLYARGVFVNRCFDELNLSNPALVRSVHEEYLDAGADLIETNTFGAHRFKLGPHGFASSLAISSGGFCRSASSVTTRSPRVRSKPARIAMCWPKLPLSSTTRVTSGRRANCSRRIAAERSRLPSLTKITS